MIAVSVVSHGHASMLPSLLAQLMKFPEISQIIVTLNIPEEIPGYDDGRIKVISNAAPKGFGANHNHAFQSCIAPFFCVLNPDIVFENNPYPSLMRSMLNDDVGLCAPIVKNSQGNVEDSVRRFPSISSIFHRHLFSYEDNCIYEAKSGNFYAEWVGGMCMLIRSSAYNAVSGFDEMYFMYVEDADICTRLWIGGYKIVVCKEAQILHDARRASRSDFRHLRWHIFGLMRYYITFRKQIFKISDFIKKLD